MPKVSPRENQAFDISKRFPFCAQLRSKQREAVEKIYSHPFGKYLLVLPGGYGKTKAAIASYVAAREAKAVNRLLIVVPGREQRDGWLDCIGDFKWLDAPVKTFSLESLHGQNLTFAASDAGLSDFARKRHRQNICEVFVITIQSLCSAGGSSQVRQMLLEKGEWMVIAEECHHLSITQNWGKAISSLDPVLLMGLSATPFRSIGEHIFSDIQDDDDRTIHCTIEDAIAEQAIRPLKVKRGKYQVEFKEPNGKIHSFKLSELDRYLYEHNLNLSEFEAKRDLRVLDQFFRPLFLEALDLLDDLNSRHPKQHQMIVHAPSVLTAKTYCAWLNMLADTSLGQAAYWVGSGAEQTDKQNAEIIQAFKNNEFPILVQVQMFGEGSDNPRASVGLWLSLLGSFNPSSHQGMVRHVRRNLNISPQFDVAYLFIPEDSPGLERALEIQAKSEYSIALKEDSEGESIFGEGTQLNIPFLEEIEQKIQASAAELLDIEDLGEEYARKLEQLKEDVRASSAQDAVRISKESGVSTKKAHEMIEEALETRAANILRTVFQENAKKISEKQVQEQWTSQVETTVKRIARNLAKRHHPVAIETSTFNATVGVLKKKINCILKRHSNGKSRQSLTTSELKRQYDYLAKLAAAIDSGNTPTDLMI